MAKVQTTHVQSTLLPPEALEGVLRLGIVGAASHVQVQIEVRDPGTGELLALWSRPHADLAQLDSALTSAGDELLRALRELLSPF